MRPKGLKAMMEKWKNDDKIIGMFEEMEEAFVNWLISDDD